MENTPISGTTLSRSKRHSREEQASYCKQWKRLNGRMTRAAFCKKIGISTKTLSKWLCSKPRSVSHKPDFIPVSGLPDTTLVG